MTTSPDDLIANYRDSYGDKFDAAVDSGKGLPIWLNRCQILSGGPIYAHIADGIGFDKPLPLGSDINFINVDDDGTISYIGGHDSLFHEADAIDEGAMTLYSIMEIDDEPYFAHIVRDKDGELKIERATTEAQIAAVADSMMLIMGDDDWDWVEAKIGKDKTKSLKATRDEILRRTGRLDEEETEED
jgi:hypothetical protein